MPGRINPPAAAGGGLDEAAVQALIDAAVANYVTKALYDANSILIATTDNTPIALPVGASRVLGRKASGAIDDMTPAEVAALFGTPTGAKFLADDGTLKTPASGAANDYKIVQLVATGNKTITSTTRAPIDATNLPYQTFDCEVGDVLIALCEFTCYGSVAQYFRFDFEVDQPTSANTFFAATAPSGLKYFYGSAVDYAFSYRGMFVCTEAGVHGVRPVAFSPTGTITVTNHASTGEGGSIYFEVQHRAAAVPF